MAGAFGITEAHGSIGKAAKQKSLARAGYQMTMRTRITGSYTLLHTSYTNVVSLHLVVAKVEDHLDTRFKGRPC